MQVTVGETPSPIGAKQVMQAWHGPQTPLRGPLKALTLHLLDQMTP